MPKLEKTFTKTIGQKVKALRRINKLTQIELASKMGLTFQQVQKYEKGISSLNPDRLKQIASIFDVKVGYFFDESDKDNQELQIISENRKLVEVMKINDGENMVYLKELAIHLSKIKSVSIKDMILEFVKVAGR
jgi:transcriptional regulator with XRE-family HTH domain